MPSRFCIHYVRKSGRPSSGHRTGKCQSSSQFPRRVVPKSVLTMGQSHSFPMLVRSCLKCCMLGFSIMWNKNFQVSKLSLEKKKELEIKLPAFAGLLRKQGNFSKTSISVSLTMLKAFDCVDYDQLWKALREMGIPDHFTCLLRNLYVGQEATVRTLYGTINWFKIKKGIWQGCLLSPHLFTYTLSTSWEMLGWMSYKLESR